MVIKRFISVYYLVFPLGIYIDVSAVDSVKPFYLCIFHLMYYCLWIFYVHAVSLLEIFAFFCFITIPLHWDDNKSLDYRKFCSLNQKTICATTLNFWGIMPPAWKTALSA